ncbi:MAG: inositol-3-phosphate synthase, partial [Candidatus Aminicenantes bacterium]
MDKGIKIENPQGKLGVLLPGMGAVATTFITGVVAVRRGLGLPIGSLTQMGTIRLGKRTEKRIPKIKEFVELADLNDLVFGGWDIFPEDVYSAALKAGVLKKELLDQVKDEISQIKPWKAVFDKNYVKKLDGEWVKQATNKYEYAQLLMEDIRKFKEEKKLDRLVMVWCASTEVFMKKHAVHETIESFEKAMKENHPAIAPSMIYAYAAIMSGVPFANGAPNLTVDIPALIELAKEKGVPIAGKDFKTGQTLMKTIIAPGLKARLLGLHGWFSTNILGNRDGEVLDDPESFKTKEESKLGV